MDIKIIKSIEKQMHLLLGDLKECKTVEEFISYINSNLDRVNSDIDIPSNCDIYQVPYLDDLVINTGAFYKLVHPSIIYNDNDRTYKIKRIHLTEFVNNMYLHSIIIGYRAMNDMSYCFDDYLILGTIFNKDMIYAGLVDFIIDKNTFTTEVSIIYTFDKDVIEGYEVLRDSEEYAIYSKTNTIYNSDHTQYITTNKILVYDKITSKIEEKIKELPVLESVDIKDIKDITCSVFNNKNYLFCEYEGQLYNITHIGSISAGNPDIMGNIGTPNHIKNILKL